MKKIFSFLTLSLLIITFISCNKESISNNKIVGTWKSSTQVTITFGSDGSYYRTLGPEGLHTYHKGTYSYNEDQCILVTNINETSFSDGTTFYDSSTQTYIVQTLTETTLVLLYTDGDSAGYFTKIK